jgi:hypothetical protein
VSNTGENSNPVDSPIACTLSADELRNRLNELKELTQDSLISAQRDDLALQLRYKLEAEHTVRRMIEREKECCAFLTFDLRIQSDAIALGISAPEAAREGIEQIYAQFLNDNALQSAQASTKDRTKVIDVSR